MKISHIIISIVIIMTPLLSFATPSPSKVHISSDGLATMTYLFNTEDEKEINLKVLNGPNALASINFFETDHIPQPLLIQSLGNSLLQILNTMVKKGVYVELSLADKNIEGKVLAAFASRSDENIILMLKTANDNIWSGEVPKTGIILKSKAINISDVISMKIKGKTQFTISEAGSSWKAIHKIQADGMLRSYAVINNNTASDWSNTKMTLGTTSTQTSIAKPMQEKRLHRALAMQENMMSDGFSNPQQLFSDHVFATKQVPQQLNANESTMLLLAGGENHANLATIISSNGGQGRFKAFVKPDENLAQGEVNVYSSQGVIASAYMNYAPKNEIMEIDLGPNPKIKALVLKNTHENSALTISTDPNDNIILNQVSTNTTELRIKGKNKGQFIYINIPRQNENTITTLSSKGEIINLGEETLIKTELDNVSFYTANTISQTWMQQKRLMPQHIVQLINKFPQNQRLKFSMIVKEMNNLITKENNIQQQHKNLTDKIRKVTNILNTRHIEGQLKQKNNSLLLSLTNQEEKSSTQLLEIKNNNHEMAIKAFKQLIN